MAALHPAWNGLLVWLNLDIHPPVEPRVTENAGFALVANRPIGKDLDDLDVWVETRDILVVDAQETLFTIDASKILNVKTLSPLYPGHTLSAIQLISLHLLLHHPDKEACSDSSFGPYIATLPRDFGFHPLTWAVDDSELIQCLPPSYVNALKKLLARYNADRVAVFEYMERHSNHPKSHLNSSAYLWSWLCVNTRCIFHHLQKSRLDPDNLSLVPILDFANHSSTLPSMIPSAATAPTKPQYGGIGSFKLLSPADVKTQAGDELYLRYGAHCNRLLFAEYGFVLPEADQPSLEVEVDDIVEILFGERGKAGVWGRGILNDRNYWKDYTLHVGYPSYRLIIALRLYAMLPMSGEVPENDVAFLCDWNDVVSGHKECVSTENEELWVRILDEAICGPIIARAEKGIAGLSEPDRAGMEMDTIRWIWEEELQVAKSVRTKIKSREEFF